MGVRANPEEETQRRLGDAYETMMLQKLYDQMRSSSGIGEVEEGPFAISHAEKIYRGMLDENMIQELAKRRPLGISDMVVRQLQRKGGVRNSGRVELNHRQ
jgi:Rod binding domain-containing protein